MPYLIDFIINKRIPKWFNDQKNIKTLVSEFNPNDISAIISFYSMYTALQNIVVTMDMPSKAIICVFNKLNISKII